ncbi:MAG TPA: immunity 17 family protein [Pirellulales bacterium]|jgi:hypothetical protein
MAGWILVAFGLFTVGAAALDFDWFMEHRKARPLVSIFGRGGARIFYVLVGAAFLVGGALMEMRIIDGGSK